MTAEEVAALFAPRKPAQVGFAMVRTEDGVKKVPLASVTVGGFEGKTGTTRRSRKGRTYKASNGRRYYTGQYEELEVIAYQVQP